MSFSLPPIENRRCNNCFYWRDFVCHGYGGIQLFEHKECRRHAPAMGSPIPQAAFPQTHESYFCGDHRHLHHPFDKGDQ